MSSTRGKNSPIRHPKDLYQTQPWVCDAWAKRAALAVGRDHVIVDLGCGDGRIGYKVAYELGSRLPPAMIDVDPLFGDVEPLDYMDTSVRPEGLVPFGYPVLFVSNPPFSLATEFAVKTVEALPRCQHGSVAVFLLRLNWYGSLGRAEWINEHRQDALTGFAPRPSFTGGGSDSCEYGLFWWFRDGPPGRFPTFGIDIDPAKVAKADKYGDALSARMVEVMGPR